MERTIEPQFLNNKKAVCIDSFYDRGRDGVQMLNSILTNVQTKIIITCGEEIQVPIPHERIHLSCPSAQDQKIIIEKIFQQDDLLIVDGDKGIVIVDPSPMILEAYRQRQAEIKFSKEKGKEIPDETLKMIEFSPIVNMKAKGKKLTSHSTSPTVNYYILFFFTILYG